jgi:hypothetical protein
MDDDNALWPVVWVDTDGTHRPLPQMFGEHVDASVGGVVRWQNDGSGEAAQAAMSRLRAQLESYVAQVTSPEWMERAKQREGIEADLIKPIEVFAMIDLESNETLFVWHACIAAIRH